MAQTVYALIVGVDEYKSTAVTSLRGAVRDAEAYAAYLRERVHAPGGATLALAGPLINGAATRGAILDGFEKHLSKARAGDVALFIFAGHGSRAKAPRELWPYEPDRKNETLVCHDSRTDGVPDLADKELAVLLGRVTESGAHVLVILDCCHSGSATRAVADQATLVRRAPDDETERPIESFVGFDPTADGPARLAARAPRPPDGPARGLGDESGWTVGPHVLLAACNEYQLASEYPSSAGERGAFSYFLIEALRAASGFPTYRDVFARAGSLLRGSVVDQSPQLETADPQLLDAPFLGGALRPSTPWHPASYRKRDGGWLVDAGRLLGLPSPSDRDPLEFALFAPDAPPQDLVDPANALGRARATTVGATWSPIELLDGLQLDPNDAYKAVVLRSPLPRLPVQIRGDVEGVGLAKTAIQAAGPGGGPSNFVRACEGDEAPEFLLVARDGLFQIFRPADDRPLVESARNAALAVRRLEHVARWTQTLRLRNAPQTFDPHAVEMTLIQGDRELQGPDYRLDYEIGPDGRPTPSRFRIRIRNNGDRDFYVGLLVLTDDFQVSDSLQRPAPCTRLLPGAEFWAYQNRPISAYIPRPLLDAGVRRRTDHLLLLVGTGDFDARLLTQPALDQERDEARPASRGLRSSLDLMLDRVQTRDLGDEGAEPRSFEDWTTSLATITIVHPDAPPPAPAPGAAAPAR